MRMLYFAATSCLLVTLNASLALAQTPVKPDRQLLTASASSQPADPQRAATVKLDTLFDPVPITVVTSTASGNCAVAAPSGASPTLPPAPAPAARSLGSAALPNYDAMPPAIVRPVTPARPLDSRKRFFIANTAMYGATVFHAFGRQAEINACIREEPIRNGVFSGGSYKGQPPGTPAKFYAISLPIDAGVTLLSALARHKGWRSFEIAAPLSAASAHLTAGAFKFSSGCY